MTEVTFSTGEIRDIVISTIALGIIFSIGSFKISGAIEQPLEFLYATLRNTIVVGVLSFIPHELAHKFAALHYKCFAQYEMWRNMIILALLVTIVSNGNFIFAAPGAVVIYAVYQNRHGLHQIVLSPHQNGLISIAGALTNISIALLFFIFAPNFFLTANIVYINTYLAAFNLLPISPLDGSKIFAWNKLIWLGMIILTGGLLLSIIKIYSTVQ